MTRLASGLPATIGVPDLRSRERSFPSIEPQAGHARGLIGAVAMEAGIRQDRPNFTLEIDCSVAMEGSEQMRLRQKKDTQRRRTPRVLQVYTNDDLLSRRFIMNVAVDSKNRRSVAFGFRRQLRFGQSTSISCTHRSRAACPTAKGA